MMRGQILLCLSPDLAKLSQDKHTFVFYYEFFEWKWQFGLFCFLLSLNGLFQGARKDTSQHPDASVGLKRPTNGSEFALSLKHIPYNGDSRETINTADAC